MTPGPAPLDPIHAAPPVGGLLDGLRRRAPDPGALVPADAPTLCPPAVAWSESELRPVRVNVTNGYADSTDIYLDRCLSHTRIGTVAPGLEAYLRLPSRMVAFDGAVRFHAYSLGDRRRLGTYSVELEPVPTLALDVSPEADTVPGYFGAFYANSRAPLRDEALDLYTDDTSGRGTVTAWSTDPEAALTMSCLDPQPRVLLSHQLLFAPADLTLRGGPGPETPVDLGVWSRRGASAPHRAPADVWPRLLQAADGGDRLHVRLSLPDEADTVFVFGVEDLARVLAEAGCPV